MKIEEKQIVIEEKTQKKQQEEEEKQIEAIEKDREIHVHFRSFSMFSGYSTSWDMEPIAEGISPKTASAISESIWIFQLIPSLYR